MAGVTCLLLLVGAVACAPLVSVFVTMVAAATERVTMQGMQEMRKDMQQQQQQMQTLVRVIQRLDLDPDPLDTVS